ncbi:hypothetical protein CRG98_032588 [Punica granatum]|uniref:Uncharacterized protein n=1 Tax=Punica granatum TaxID=22663 RepID=A0A2I0ISS3_PUNGR|nr:hypothetical protein CRG98_032588 [Punica granatum]
MKEPRISIVEFFNLTKWKDSDQYGPLPELVFPDRPAIYRDFTKQEFLDNFYSKGLDNKSLIDRIKVIHESDYHRPLAELVSPEREAIYREFTKQEFLENFCSMILDNKSSTTRS